MKRGAWIAGIAAVAMSFAGAAHATLLPGQPTDRAMQLQPAATDIMREITAFHDFLLWIIVAITIFVAALLMWVMIRYNRHANPTPKKFTHNMLVEVIWTVVPVLILVVIAWKSFPLIYREERIPEQAELTLKVTGNSWFWNLEYPDAGVTIAANLLPEEDARAQNRPYLLATTEPLLVPVDTTVRVLVTSNDVIHAFAIPAFGVKEDAIQGRVNETWFNVDTPGVYYGQCSELCGVNHAYMPIEIRAVSRAEFDAWIAEHGGAFASAEPAPAATPPAAGEGAATTPPAATEQPAAAPSTTTR
ncbi:MAG: cytochrome c oxidase subunit II [Hyphomonadaceae bacterium]|nr:cytochrome c oxidase subunit II [Hyphomonadaceae bacterium]